MQDLINQLQPGLLDEHLGPLRERLKLRLGREDLRSDEIRKRIRILHMASRPVEPRFFSIVTQATLMRRRLNISCEAYARILERRTNPVGRQALAEEYASEVRIPDERVHPAEAAGIVLEATAARNGWKVILARCAPERRSSF